MAPEAPRIGAPSPPVFFKAAATQRRIIPTNTPTHGKIGAISHHPVRFLSWRRRTAAQRFGAKKTSIVINMGKYMATKAVMGNAFSEASPPAATPLNTTDRPTPAPMVLTRICTTYWNRKNHQYSDRQARPCMVTYFHIKPVLTDSPNPIMGTLLPF